MASSTGPFARAEDDGAEALEERAARMERALLTIAREISHALEHPEIQHLALCRLATIVNRALPPDDDDERQSGVQVTPAAPRE